jgi:hypothetical protein
VKLYANCVVSSDKLRNMRSLVRVQGEILQNHSNAHRGGGLVDSCLVVVWVVKLYCR